MNSQKTPIVMFGAAGRMGRMILTLAAEAPETYQIVGAVEHPDHPLLGRPLAEWIPGAPTEIMLNSTPPEHVPGESIGIDFSHAEATAGHLDWCLKEGNGALIGTTGLSAEQRKKMESAAALIPILITPNTSLGVNVLFWLAEQAARLLGREYEVEIVEMHHHHKKDAPSGTARALAESVLKARGGDYERDARHGRVGLVGERKPDEIGLHALRGGDVVGDHTAIFAGPGERIELVHRAHSRETFARGALRAAAWLKGRRPGLYAMKDVLGL